jgi:CRISPR-associated endonuclease/helicase Cas3
VLRRRDLDALFDTSADLSGADLDVSRFIRSGDERDVSVFWRTLDDPGAIRLDEPPRREELCPVPIGDIRGWKHWAWVLDYLDGAWTRRDVKRLVPGMIVLLDARRGGYTVERGWDGKAKSVEPVPLVPIAADADLRASSIEDGEDLSSAPWKTIATHGREAEEQARRLCITLGVPGDLARVVALAARWHDAGKVHRIFQDAIHEEGRRSASAGARRDLAKAPKDAWRRPPYPERPGFRHELASTLALFELLRRAQPMHPALLGRHRDLLGAIGTPVELPAASEAHPLADEIAALSADDFDLLAWLVCTHHGKVRCAWTSTPHDQEKQHGGIHGVCEGDVLPAFTLTQADGRDVEVPPIELSLAGAEMGVGPRYGAAWGERVSGLLARLGPFTLTFLEAVLRLADWRASALATKDPRL